MVDFWGPRCELCLQLMPGMGASPGKGEALRVIKIDAPKPPAVA